MSKIRNFSSYGEKPTIGHYDQDLTNVPVPKSRRDNNYAVDDLGIIHDRISLECIELLDKNDAKGYLMEHATKTACWGTKTARNVTITAINNYNIYKYELKTLIEKRTAKRISRPYKQNKEVNTDFSKLPEAWDVEIKGTNEYLRLKKNSIVPHSHKIEICKACEGIGHNRCTKCQGLMKLNCKNCIKGQVDGKKCGKCKGANEFTCALCKGKGTKPCRYCSGAGKFLWYVIIEATFEPVETEKVINNYENVQHKQIPTADLNKSQWIDLYKYGNSMKIKDISNIPDKEIDKLVGEIRQEHIEKSTSGLIRQQYQYLSCLPVARVAYQYNDNHYGSFYVMGSNRHVFSPTYPESCCCCCQCRYCYQCRCQIM